MLPCSDSTPNPEFYLDIVMRNDCRQHISMAKLVSAIVLDKKRERHRYIHRVHLVSAKVLGKKGERHI